MDLRHHVINKGSAYVMAFKMTVMKTFVTMETTATPKEKHPLQVIIFLSDMLFFCTDENTFKKV